MLRTTDLSPNGQLRDDVDPVFVGNPPGVRFLLEDGDLLLTRSGSVGRSFLVRALSDPTTFAGFLIRFRPRPSTDPRFLAYVAESTPFQDAVQADAISSTIQNFNAERYANIKVPNPPLDEQRRIADFLDTETARLDHLVALRSSQLNTLSEHYLSALQDLYVGRPTPDFLEGRADSSNTRPLRYLLSRTVSGRTPDAALVDDGPVPWLAIGDLVDGGEVEAGSRSFSASTLGEMGLTQAPAGSVVLAMYASLGKVSTLTAPSVFNQAIIGLVPRHEVPAGYLVGWLELAQPSLPALARTATQPNLNAEQVRSLRFPRNEPHAMAEIAARRTALKDHLRRTSSTIDNAQRLVTERRQALITAAVTGQLDVTTARQSHP